MNEHIHIVFGESPAGIINRVIKPKKGNLLVNFDPLSCGPLPKFKNLEYWKNIRRDFIATIYSEEPDFSFHDYKHDILNNIEGLKKAEQIYLWIGSGLAEQIFYVWLIQLLQVISADLNKLRIVQFHQAPNKKFEVVSIGLLNPDQLSKHPPPKILTNKEIEHLNRVWDVISGSDPLSLLSLLKEKAGPLPLLSRSLRYLLGRFPDYKSGLGFWDEKLLHYTLEKGPKAARIIGHTIGNTFDNLDWIGDQYLYHRLRNMGNHALKQQLVELKGRSPKMRDTDVYLINTGRSVLSGEVNNVELNGLDDWICGIHLDSNSGNIWYRKNGDLLKS